MKSLWWFLFGLVVPLEAQTLIAVRWWMRRYDQQGDNTIKCYISTNGGTTWIYRGLIDVIYANDGGLGLAITPDPDLARLYFLFQPGESTGNPTRPTRAYYSEDTGLTWQVVGTMGVWDQHDYATAGLIAVSGGKLLAYALGMDDCLKIRYSTDGGCSWLTKPDLCMGYASPDPEGDMTFDETGRVYLINWQNTSPPKCYVSTDWGQSWPQSVQVSSTSGYYNCRASDITYDPLTHSLFAVIWTGNINPTVYRSTDRGNSWGYAGTITSDYMDGDGSAAIASDSLGNLYVLLWDDYTDLRLFVSTNGGSSWTYRSTVATGDADICACGTELVVLDAMPLSFQEEDGEAPLRLFVTGNKVSFILPSPGNCSLVIYDPVGRKVKDLWNGQLETGFHSFSLGGLDKGVYLLRVHAEGMSSTVRFVQ